MLRELDAGVQTVLVATLSASSRRLSPPLWGVNVDYTFEDQGLGDSERGKGCFAHAVETLLPRAPSVASILTRNMSTYMRLLFLRACLSFDEKPTSKINASSESKYLHALPSGTLVQPYRARIEPWVYPMQ